MKLPWDAKSKIDRSQGGYQRERSDDPYHTARWTRLSRSWRKAHPLCEECKRKGIIKAAEVTDHVIPWPVCGDFFDVGNLQSLCEECNNLKGQRDKQVIQEWRRKQQSR